MKQHHIRRVWSTVLIFSESICREHISYTKPNRFEHFLIFKKSLPISISNQALQVLAAVAKSPEVAAVVDTIRDSVTGIHNMVYLISQGTPPRKADIAKLSDLAKEALQRTVYFYRCAKQEPKSMGAGKLTVHATVTVSGPEALVIAYDEMKKLMDAKATVQPKQLRPLRQFIFYFSAEKQREIDGWVQRATRNNSKFAALQSITDGKASESVGGEIVAVSASSSASSSCAAESPSKMGFVKRGLGKDEVTEMHAIEKKSKMMRFFKPTVAKMTA